MDALPLDERQPIVKKVMSCGNFLNHGDTPLHQSQKEFIVVI
jgi:hypothetical protein